MERKQKIMKLVIVLFESLCWDCHWGVQFMAIVTDFMNTACNLYCNKWDWLKIFSEKNKSAKGEGWCGGRPLPPYYCTRGQSWLYRSSQTPALFAYFSFSREEIHVGKIHLIPEVGGGVGKIFHLQKARNIFY